MASAEWHWEQGTEYATEAIKTTLLLNGAAAIALMTFAGTTPQKFSPLLICPLLSFVIGAVFSALAFFAAYMTQLNFGNAELDPHKRDETHGGNAEIYGATARSA
jgi:hypothetical protein